MLVSVIVWNHTDNDMKSLETCVSQRTIPKGRCFICSLYLCYFNKEMESFFFQCSFTAVNMTSLPYLKNVLEMVFFGPPTH